MTWIHFIPPDKASGHLKDVYEEILRSRGTELAQGPSARPFMLHSLNPEAMRHISAFRDQIFEGESRLTRAQRKMISTVTSASISCPFCTLTHAEFFRNAGGDDLLADQLKLDWRKADIAPEEYAMLAFAEKLTRIPDEMRETDIEALRNAGWSDRDILDIAQVCAYMNFRTRVVNALGMKPGEWQETRAREGSKRALQGKPET